MNSPLSIETRWIDNNTMPEDAEAATICAMKITANNACLTKNAILRTNSYTDEAILSAYPLALWVCSSWWRLAYEPAPSNDLASYPHDWRMAHELAAAGGGYVWPAITFMPDGNEVTIFSAHKNEQDVVAESLLYVGAEKQRISLDNFLHSMDVFVSSVVERIKAYKMYSTELSTLWAQLQEEDSDKEQRMYRIIEARLGFDPDQCPREIMRKISGTFRRFDDETAQELASQCSRYESEDIVANIERIAAMSVKGIPGTWGVNDFSHEHGNNFFPPWDYGRKIARSFRQYIKTKSGKVDSKTLYNILGITKENIKNFIPNDAVFSLSHRKNNTLRVNIKTESSRNYATSIRFQLSRLIGACLLEDGEEYWLPITMCKTWKQIVQRAFATEFLSPITEVREVMGGPPSEERIAKTAKHFQVSPQTILHGLANHGDIRRSDLWQFVF